MITTIGSTLSSAVDVRPVAIEPRQRVALAVPAASAGAIDPNGRSLAQVVEQAARDRFPDREVAVESFYDEESGRYVHRIADGESGEILLQTPPDELLRFFASGREPFGEPLVRLEA